MREHYARSLVELDVKQRRVIRLNNPLISELGAYRSDDYLLTPEGKINY